MKKLLSILFVIFLVLFSLWSSRHYLSAVGDIRTAQDHFLKGSYAEAIQIFESLSERDKDQNAARLGLFHALLITGQYGKVEELAQRFRKEHPNELFPYVSLGKAYARRGQYAEALQAFEKVVKGSPSIMNEAQLNHALVLETTGRLEESRADFSALYARAMGEGHTQLGFAAIAAQHTGRYREANALFQQATAANPNDYDSWIAWGNLFLETYDPGRAVTMFAKVLKLNPHHPEAFLGIALSRGEEQGSEVQKILKEALEVNSNLEEARVALAAIALDTEAFEECERQLALALTVNPKSLPALSVKALLSYAGEREMEFQNQTQEVLRLNPRYGEIYERFANFCVTQRLYQQSVLFLRKAIEVRPDFWRAYSGLGVNLLRLGEENSAKEVLEKAYKNDPYNLWTVNTLRLIDSYEHFDRLTTPNFTLKLHKNESKLLEFYVPALLEQAYQTLSAKFKYYPPRPVYFEMFPDHEDFAVRTLGMPGLGALGVCFGRGVVMDSPSARPKGTFNWGSTLWHEFAHVITLGITEHRIPRWFTEGISVMEEHKAKPGWGNDLTTENIKAIQEKKLLPIAELNSGFIRPKSHNQVQQSYFQAGQACEFIEKEFGFERILQMIELFKTRHSLERTLKQALNLSPPEFDQKFHAYLETLYGQTLRNVDFSIVTWKRGPEERSKLELLLKEQPDNFFANLKLAGYHRDEGQLDEAVRCLTKAKSVFPGYVESDSPYEQLSKIYKKQDRLTEAISELRDLVDRDDDDFNSLKQLAEWLVEAGKSEEASKALQNAMYIDPFNRSAHELLGKISFKNNDLPLALRTYQALLALHPPDAASAHFHVASVLFEMGKRVEAKKEALTALEIAPGFEPAQELLLKTID
jgi:tetratricopeptide (TPR) repeat protein